MDFQQEPRLRRLPTRTFLSRLGVDFAKVPDHARVIVRKHECCERRFASPRLGKAGGAICQRRKSRLKTLPKTKTLRETNSREPRARPTCLTQTRGLQ
jgi:hypothetical protein